MELNLEIMGDKLIKLICFAGFAKYDAAIPCFRFPAGESQVCGMHLQNNTTLDMSPHGKCAGKYRVVHVVLDKLFVDSEIRVALSKRSLFCCRTFNLMSTNSVPRPDGPPCNYLSPDPGTPWR